MLKRHSHIMTYHLNRSFASIPDKKSAQRRMTTGRLAPGSFERIYLQFPFDLKRQLPDVHFRLTRINAVKEQPLLYRRQRVSIFDLSVPPSLFPSFPLSLCPCVSVADSSITAARAAMV